MIIIIIRSVENIIFLGWFVYTQKCLGCQCYSSSCRLTVDFFQLMRSLLATGVCFPRQAAHIFRTYHECKSFHLFGHITDHLTCYRLQQCYFAAHQTNIFFNSLRYPPDAPSIWSSFYMCGSIVVITYLDFILHFVCCFLLGLKGTWCQTPEVQLF